MFGGRSLNPSNHFQNFDLRRWRFFRAIFRELVASAASRRAMSLGMTLAGNHFANGPRKRSPAELVRPWPQ